MKIQQERMKEEKEIYKKTQELSVKYKHIESRIQEESKNNNSLNQSVFDAAISIFNTRGFKRGNPVDELLMYNREIEKLDDKRKEIMKKLHTEILKTWKNRTNICLSTAIVIFDHELDGKFIRMAMQPTTQRGYKCRVCMRCIRKDEINNFKYKWLDPKTNKESEWAFEKIVTVGNTYHPDDIIWENLKVNWWKRAFIHTVILILTYIPILGSFVIMTFLFTEQYKMNHNKDTDGDFFNLERLYAFAVSISIGVINYLNSLWIRFLAEYEGWPTRTKKLTHITKRQVFAEIVNNCLVFVFGTYSAYEKTIFGDAAVEGGLDAFRVNMWKSYGLGSNAMMLMATNSICHTAINLFNIPLIYNRFKRKWVMKYKDNYTQHEANTIFEGPQPDICEWYANSIVTLCMSLFY